MNKKKIVVSLLILAASAIFYLYLYSKRPIYGIITAMPSESSVFLENMQDKKTVVKNKVQYYVGNIAGKHVVLVVTGIGKINAAAITSRLIENYHPASIIFSGIAGSVNKKLKIGDIVIGESIYNAESLRISDDLSNDDLNLNNKPNQEYLWADAQLLLFAKSVGKNIKNMYVVPGLIATTDIFPPEFRQIKNLEEKK